MPSPLPTPDDPLARLAADGERRTLEASARKDARARDADDDGVRAALGHFWSWPSVGSLAVGVVVLVVPLVVGVPFWWCGAPALVAIGTGLGLAIKALASPTRAAPERVAAERAWTTSFPFAIDGYFEALSASPTWDGRLSVTLAFAAVSPAPEKGTLRAIFGVLDTDAEIETRGGAATVVRLRLPSDNTAAKTAYYELRTMRIVAYVHELVDRVLVPLHRSHAIARVSVTRG